jgi:hypothetical protein
MTLFVAVVNDRHIDPIIGVFSTSEAAIKWASETFRDCVAYPEEITKGDLEGTYIWHEIYGEEGDYSLVEITTLNNP